MPVTFGSVGDIITVALLIKDLIKCIDDSRGSSAEYQAVIRELWSLDRALLEVELLLLSSQRSKELDAIQGTALHIAKQCDSCIKTFRDHIKKYQNSLQRQSSGTFVKNAARKVIWHTSEKEPLARFRAEIIAHCLSINMLVASAGVKTIHITDENMQREFKKVKLDQEQSSAAQEALLADIKSHIMENRTEMQATRTEIQSVGSYIDSIRNFGAELLCFMQNIWKVNVLTYKAVVTLHSRIPPQLERCWTQEPITLRDPLGRVAPVHLEFIETWEAFQSMLEVRFRQMPGHNKVRRKEYALEANRWNQDINDALTFRRWFRPGQEVDMSMVFERSAGRTISCPGCGVVATGSLDSKIRCQGCDMSYQRIEIEQELPKEPQTPDLTEAKIDVRKRKRQEDLHDDDDDSNDDSPSQFCRVRLNCWKFQNLSFSAYKDQVSGELGYPPYGPKTLLEMLSTTRSFVTEEPQGRMIDPPISTTITEMGSHTRPSIAPEAGSGFLSEEENMIDNEQDTLFVRQAGVKQQSQDSDSDSDQTQSTDSEPVRSDYAERVLPPPRRRGEQAAVFNRSWTAGFDHNTPEHGSSVAVANHSWTAGFNRDPPDHRGPVTTNLDSPGWRSPSFYFANFPDDALEIVQLE